MRVRSVLVAVVTGWVLACSGTSSPAGPTGVLTSLEQGDTACYVAFQPAEGEELYLDGDFELCPGGGADASALIGKLVSLQTEKATVQAGSCEGNPDCTDTEDVDLVIGISASP